MLRYFYLTTPEHFYLLRKSKDSWYPVIPLHFSVEDINRIVPFCKRKEIPFAGFYDSGIMNSVIALANASVFPAFFLVRAKDAELLRKKGYTGKLFLLSSFTSLTWKEWFTRYSVTPVTSNPENFGQAEKDGLKPFFFASTSHCIAEPGYCISRKTQIQYPFSCDLRCREKSSDNPSVDFPFSLRPNLAIPETAAGFFLFTEHYEIPVVSYKPASVPSRLNEWWNYRYPIGTSLIKPGARRTQDDWVFSLAADDIKRFESSEPGYWAYSQNLYQGHWLTPQKVTLSHNRKLHVKVETNEKKLLLVEKYPPDVKLFLKEARHFLFTMPITWEFKEPLIEEQEDSAAILRTAQPRRRHRSLTIITDHLDQVSVFRANSVGRIVLLYHPGMSLPRFFHNYLYIQGPVSMAQCQELDNLPHLKGVVVTDYIQYALFSSVFGERKEVLYYPLYNQNPGPQPALLTARLPYFTSLFTSDQRKNYVWKSLNTEMHNQAEYALFLSRRKMIFSGSSSEVWVDIRYADTATVRFLKQEAEKLS